MKILHIIDSLGLGGAQTVVKGIFEKQKENKEIFLYALRKRNIKIEIKHKNVKIYNSNKKYSFAPIKELKELIEKEKIEILHCHLFRAQVFGWILKKSFPNIKLIIHEHGQIFQKDFHYNKFMKIAQKQTDLFLAVSKATKQKLIEKAKINPNKIKVLYNFVDLDKFNRKNIKININKEKKKLGIEKDEFVVGFAGRLIERKGWREFVLVAKALCSQNNIKFLIAGDGPDKKKLCNLIKKYNLENKMKFLGYQKNILKFYSLLGCFVMPSYWEGLPMVQLEVMSFGIPLIISDGPGMDEVTMNNKDCLYTKIKNINSIKNAISYLIANPNLRMDLIENSKKKVKEFSLKNYVKDLNQIYRNLK